MFDPYHKWLGIPKVQRPPTHYQLLGLAPDEQDLEVIEEAAIRQTTHVRAYQIGVHGAECTKLQKEIATARLTLVNPAKRKAYDEQLAQAGTGQAAMAATGEAGIKAGDPQRAVAAPDEAEILDEPSEDAAQSLHKQKRSDHVKKAGAPLGLLIGLGAGAGVLLLIVIIAIATFWWLGGDTPPRKIANPLVENKARDDKKPVRDADVVNKDDAPKKDDTLKKVEAPKKDDTKGEIKLKKPDAEPAPGNEAETPTTVLATKGRMAAKLLVDLPKDAISPKLSDDGMRVVYTLPSLGVVCYRDAPAFAKEQRVRLTGDNVQLTPAAISRDGKKMALAFNRLEHFDVEKVLLWDWDKMAVEGSYPIAGRPMQVVFAPDMKHMAASSIRVVKAGQFEFWVHLYCIGAKEPELRRWKLDAHLHCFGFSADSGRFFFMHERETQPHTFSMSSGETGWMSLAPARRSHTFSGDFSCWVFQDGRNQLHVGNLDPRRTLRMIRGPQEKTVVNGEQAAFSPDNSLLLVGMKTGDQDENAQIQVAMIDLKSGEVVSVTDPCAGSPRKMQLAANGVALLHRNNLPSRLYRFPIGPGDVFVKNDPPKQENPLPKETENNVIKDNPRVKAARIAVPDADKILESEKTIRDQFKKEYAKKAPSDLFALAEKLYKLAGETTDDPVACYALLREARDLAIKAGRAELAMKAVTELCAKYEMDELAQRVDTLLSFSKIAFNAEGYKQFVEIALLHAGHAMMDDHFDESLKVMGVAEAVARRSGIAALLPQVLKQDKQIKEVAKDHADMKIAQAKLAGDATDAEASLTVGLYLAFRKGNWEQGLPLLTRGSNAALQDLAKKDLAVTDNDKARVEAGDGWWAGAEKMPAFQKAAMQWRAAYWYRQALPSLKGLTEATLSGRIKQVDAQPAPFRVAAGAGEVDRFKGHTGAVTFLNLSADGKRLYSCGADGTLRSWELATGKSRVLLGPPVYKIPLIGFAVSPDERQVALLKPGNKMFEVDLQTLKPAFGGLERDAVPGMYWSSNTRVNYHFKTSSYIWNPIQTSNSSEGSLVFTNPPITGNVRAVVLSPQHDMCAALISGEAVVAFRLPNTGFASTQATIKFDATAAALSKDTGLLVLGGKEGALRMYPIKVKTNDNAKEFSSFKGHSGTIRAIACAPDGNTMVSGGDDKTVRVWDMASGIQLQRFSHPGTVTSLVVTPDGRHVISACADSMIRVWRLAQ